MPSTSSSSTIVATHSAFLGSGGSGSNGCGCDDLSLKTANTGMNTISVANSNLAYVVAPTGSYQTVFTAGESGSIISSIIIKATQQLTGPGMVRLFISNNKSTTDVTLYKEIPIPPTPQAASVPIPVPQYTLYEAILLGDLKLNAGYSILASTQNATSFNVIVEGLDWDYPESPTMCCNLEEETANTGLGVISVANPNLDGVTGAYTTIFTAGSSANGSLINRITIKALGSTQEDIIRIFIGNGTDWYLMQEIWVPLTTQSAYEPSYKQVVAANFNLQAGYMLEASTQNGVSYAITVEAEDITYGV